jgi:hypothetical protein
MFICSLPVSAASSDSTEIYPVAERVISMRSRDSELTYKLHTRSVNRRLLAKHLPVFPRIARVGNAHYTVALHRTH